METDLTALIRSLEDRLKQAQFRSDADALDALLADDLLFTALDGHPSTKAADLEAHRSGFYEFLESTRVSLEIRPLAPTVAVAVSVFDMRVRVQGVETAARLCYTRVWAERNERWQLAAGHMSAVQG